MAVKIYFKADIGDLKLDDAVRNFWEQSIVPRKNATADIIRESGVQRKLQEGQHPLLTRAREWLEHDALTRSQLVFFLNILLVFKFKCKQKQLCLGEGFSKSGRS